MQVQDVRISTAQYFIAKCGMKIKFVSNDLIQHKTLKHVVCCIEFYIEVTHIT